MEGESGFLVGEEDDDPEGEGGFLTSPLSSIVLTPLSSSTSLLSSIWSSLLSSLFSALFLFPPVLLDFFFPVFFFFSENSVGFGVQVEVV